jgi:toxin FitB
MIILDTNVVSELMRPRPDAAVVDWLDQQAGGSITVTAMTIAELLHGLLRLPEGRRRTDLGAALLDVLTVDLAPTALAFDALAAEHYAEIVVDREAAGRPIGVADAVIAATCRASGATLATRNVRDFDLTGVELIDPWLPDQPSR